MKIKKLLSMLLTVLIMLSALPISAYAQSSTGSTSGNTSVGEDYVQKKKTQYADVKESNTKTKVALTVEDSNLVVSVPTTIIVNGTPNNNGEYIGKYSVGVSGDMSGNKEVTIEPESSNIELQQKGKTNHNAVITQEKTLFNSDDFKNNVTTNGTVTATGLTAGSWNGITNFNIGINLLPNEPIKGYTTLYEYDLSATENDNVKAYYAVPNKNTSPISKSQKKMAKSSSNIVVSNGIKYTLSDDDTLVITGEGDMKPYISNDFYDYDAFYKDIASQFDDKYYIVVYDQQKNTLKEYNSQYVSCGSGLHKAYKILFYNNSTVIDSISRWQGGVVGYVVYSNDSVKTEINEYIESIKDKYLEITPKNIVVSEGIKNIPAYSFAGMEYIENISFPESLQSIGEYAFNSCTNIKKLDLKNVSELGKFSFHNCIALEDVRVPYSIDYGNMRCFTTENISSIKTIKKVTFYNTDGSFIDYTYNGLTNGEFWRTAEEIVFEEGITHFSSGMFRRDVANGPVKKITIPKTAVEMPYNKKMWSMNSDKSILANNCIVNYSGTIEQFQFLIGNDDAWLSNLYINGQPYQANK